MSGRVLARSTANGDRAVGLLVPLVEPENRARARLTRLLKEAVEVEAFPSLDAMEQEMDLTLPGPVVVGPSYSNEMGLKDILLLTRDRPHLGCVLVVEEMSTALLQQALRAGVRDVVARPRDALELLEAVERVAEAFGGLAPNGAAARDAESHGRLVTVVSTKGGAGKSVVASNLGVALAKAVDKPVALVDADLQFGDAAIMLNLAPEHTLVDVMSAIRRLDAATLQRLLVPHGPSGLLVLPAPVEPAFADQVGAADMVRIVNVLRSFCAYVVVDTAPQLNDVVLALVEESDDVLLVCAPEVPNVKNAKLALQTLRLLNTPISKIKLVVNRANSKARLDLRDVEHALQLKVEAGVASDLAVPRSINEGEPVVLSAPRSPAAKGLTELSRLLLARESRT